MENRGEVQCLWLSRTQNKKGLLAEIFKVDSKERKGCLLVLESVKKTGWRFFFNMLNYKEDAEKYFSSSSTKTQANKEDHSSFSSSETKLEKKYSRKDPMRKS